MGFQDTTVLVCDISRNEQIWCLTLHTTCMALGVIYGMDGWMNPFQGLLKGLPARRPLTRPKGSRIVTVSIWHVAYR